MAVTRKENVIVVAADDDTVDGPLSICGIKYKAGTGTPSIAIKADKSSSGLTLWETASSSDVFEDVELEIKGGIHVDLAGTGTLLYLYLK